MGLPLYIAKRYLFARKSHNIINVISAISAIGMAIGTAALILILSVYNGFDSIIRDNLSDIDPDYLVVPAEGKVFVPEGEAFDWLYGMGCVSSLCSVVEDNVFVSYDGKQAVAKAKGVDEVYEAESPLAGHLVSGDFNLRLGDIKRCVVGSGLASKLTLNPRFLSGLELWYPDRTATVSPSNPAASLQKSKVWPAGIVSVNADTDNSLLVLPIETMRSLLRYDGEVSAVEVRTDGSEPRGFREDLQKRLGDGFRVLDRYMQHSEMFKMIQYEKAAIFLILLFVVIIVAFNIFSSLSMLVVEKADDISTLRSLGATEGMIRKVFVLEGWMISLAGLAAGLVIGLAVAWLQMKFGFVRMPGSSFSIQAYPVIIKWTDIVLTAVSVAAVGYIIALIPSRIRKPSEQRI